MPRLPKVKIEKVSEDDNGATYYVEAIHVTTTRNKRKYTKEELTLGARSLSYRPININHDEERWLPYNFANPVAKESNCTLNMEFMPEKNGVVGEVWISDKTTRENLDAGNIKTVSIEQLPTKGETCACLVNDCTCEQNGIVFTGIALLETFKGVEPGDPGASIRKECSCNSPKPREQNKGGVTPEATIDQITNDVLEDMAKKIQAQYDLVNALEQKVALTPNDTHLAEDLQKAKWSLFYMVMDYMKLKKGEEKAPEPKDDKWQSSEHIQSELIRAIEKQMAVS